MSHHTILRYEIEVSHVAGAFKGQGEIEEALEQDMPGEGATFDVEGSEYEVTSFSSLPDNEELVKAASAAVRLLQRLTAPSRPYRQKAAYDAIPATVQRLEQAIERTR